MLGNTFFVNWKSNTQVDTKCTVWTVIDLQDIYLTQNVIERSTLYDLSTFLLFPAQVKANNSPRKQILFIGWRLWSSRTLFIVIKTNSNYKRPKASWNVKKFMFRLLEHLIDFNHLTNFKRHPKLTEHMHIHWMIQQIFAYGYALLFRLMTSSTTL